MRILGIDCSSTCIGLALLEIEDSKITLIKSDYFKPNKNGTIVERLADTRNKIKIIIEEWKPDHIAIEDIIQFIARGSTAKTIITLASFNRMICLLACDYLSRSPELFSVMSIRHGIKMNKLLPKKEQIPDLVAKQLKIKFDWKLNKNGKPDASNFDRADAIAVGLYYSLILTGKIIKKRKSK